MSSHLIAPYGGKLTDLMLDEARAAEAKHELRDLPSWDITPRQLCDLEMLLNGAFSPLKGFMNRKQYQGVCEEMRLTDGTLWPLPVTLDVDDAAAVQLEPGSRLALRDPEGMNLAIMEVEEIWKPDKQQEARQVFGRDTPDHPGVDYLLNRAGPWYLGGRIFGLHLPFRYDFKTLRHTPRELRALFSKRGWRRVAAFQTRNPMHRAHQEMTFQAAREHQTNLLIHPVVGTTKPGDLDHYTRVRCYQAILSRYPKNTIMLSLLPLAMRMAGPREALLHAIIRRNYGCTHLIVGRDHAGPGSDSKGKAFYGQYDAQKLMHQCALELCVCMIPFKQLVYVKDEDAYLPEDHVPDGADVKTLSGTELRERLAEGREIPDWFSYPEVIKELRKNHPPRKDQGFCVFFTGLSGAGKSTVANVLLVKLLEMGTRPVTLLDGDIVRKNLSSELGFSPEHRDLNILRIGFVASEITKNRGIAICAPIAPYDRVRKEVRSMISARGGFILVHVCTPLEVCELRDRKGMYTKARAGIIKNFTGISDPYEAPRDAEIPLDTTNLTPEEAAQQVLLYLEKTGYIS
jgi:sulfate adenylyltransferase